MNTQIVLAAGVLALATFPALADSKTYDVAAFDRAEFSSSVSATIVIGPTQSVVAEAADPAVLEDLRVQVVAGRLNVWLESDFWDLFSFRSDDVHVSVTVPALTGIVANSSADVKASGIAGEAIDVEVSSSASVVLTDLAVKSARLEASSSGDLVLDGTCVTASVQVSSSATVAGDRFECVDLDIDASSSAKARLFATGQVNADVSSSAKVELFGKPAHVDDDVSSSGDVDVI
jgi:hypothetical protein